MSLTLLSKGRLDPTFLGYIHMVTVLERTPGSMFRGRNNLQGLSHTVLVWLNSATLASVNNHRELMNKHSTYIL